MKINKPKIVWLSKLKFLNAFKKSKFGYFPKVVKSHLKIVKLEVNKV